jgi:hypothetical protein
MLLFAPFENSKWRLVLNYIKDCQSILEEVVSADRTKKFSRNLFSRTAEGIELKSGIYVPMNVFNM